MSSDIVGFNGPPRSGKTAGLSLLGLKDLRKGRALYCNYPIAGGVLVTPYDVLKFLELGAQNASNSPLYHATLCAQEFQTWIESRLGTSKTALAITDFICQAPKLGFKLYYDAQLNSSVDKRLKQNASARWECEKTKRGFRYWQLDLEYTEENVRTGRKKFVPKEWMARHVFPYYNTRKVSLRPDFCETVAALERQDPEKLVETVERQVQLLLKNRGLWGKIAQRNVEWALMKLGEPVTHACYVAVALELSASRR